MLDDRSCENCKFAVRDYVSVIGVMKHCCDKHWHCKPGSELNDYVSKYIKGWQPISEYSKKHDWVLVKGYDGDFECIPIVAERRKDGKWYTQTSEQPLPFTPQYFFDMQQLDNYNT